MSPAKFFSFILVLSGAAALAGWSGSAAAQAYPTKVVRIVVPFPAGQAADTIMRIIAERLHPTLGQPVIVENRAGAGGAIGMEYVASQPPDGHTLVMGGSGPTSINPLLQPSIRYDPLKDFEPVTAVASVPQVFMVNPSFEAKDLRQLIALAKAKPGQINFGSSGAGTTQHLFVEYFASMAGIKLTHVPYKGSPQVISDLLGGHIPLASDTVPVALPLVKSGKVRALGVTSLQRSPFLPEVPTLNEQGVKGYNAVGWISVLAPAGTPAPILDRLAGDIRKIMAQPDVQKRFAELGFTPMSETREQLRTFVRSEMTKWRKVIADAGVKVE
jgi:tripartite-type tricarboxylate transporter receptor subunit TctC